MSRGEEAVCCRRGRREGRRGGWSGLLVPGLWLAGALAVAAGPVPVCPLPGTDHPDAAPPVFRDPFGPGGGILSAAAGEPVRGEEPGPAPAGTTARPVGWVVAGTRAQVLWLDHDGQLQGQAPGMAVPRWRQRFPWSGAPGTDVSAVPAGQGGSRGSGSRHGR